MGGEKEKRLVKRQKKAAAASADKPAKADRAAMAAPGAVEYAGKDTDKPHLAEGVARCVVGPQQVKEDRF